METLAERIRAAHVQALAQRAKRAEEQRQEKENKKKQAAISRCYTGLVGQVLAFMKAEKFTPQNMPVEGVTTHDLKLAFPEEEVSSLRWALWQLAKCDLATKTDQTRQPERGRPALAVWKAL